MRIVVVGGNAAGMSAAGRAARLDPDLDITVLEQGGHVAYSICGAPYYIAGDVPSVDNLVVYTPERFHERRGVRVCTRVRAETIETSRRRLLATEIESRHESAFPYDRLLIATGYRAQRIDVPGADLQNIFTLASLDDAVAIERSAAGARRALVVGGGLVGVEMAETLTRRGLQVTLIEKTDRILRGLDPHMSAIVEEELARNGVRVEKGRTVRSFFGSDGCVRSAWVQGWAEPIEADLVLVDVGVVPEVSLAEAAGIAIGRSGAIAVSERMETSSPSIYAAGNCAEALHLVSNRPVTNALGTAANKQGRVAGENLAGRPSIFRGVLDAWVVRVFGLAVARTGLTEEDARACGFRCASARITGRSRSRYLPDSDPVTIQALADRSSRRLLGLQAIGGGADKRVDVASVVLHAGMTVDEAAQLDLCYAPPYSQVWDPFLVAMNVLLKEL